MSRPSPTAVDRRPGEDRRQRRTALAFLLAPGIAALFGGLVVTVLSIASGSIEHVGRALVGGVIGVLMLGLYFGLVGYLTAVVVSAPLYSVLPARVRGRRVAVVLLAGGSAAAPWLAFSPFGGAGALIAAAVAFLLGCVAGVAFVLIRGGVSAGDRP